MFGLALGLLEAKPLAVSIRLFNELQGEFNIDACEVHGEDSLYESVCRIGNKEDVLSISCLRQNVKKPGLHLPFMNLNPVSKVDQKRDTTISIFHIHLNRGDNLRIS